MKYSDYHRIKKILDYAEKLMAYVNENGITKDQILKNETLQWLITTPLYNIGEHVYYLSDEYKERHPEVIWPMISGLRHRLVHDYDGTNWNIIADVVYEEVPDLISNLKKYIDEEENPDGKKI